MHLKKNSVRQLFSILFVTVYESKIFIMKKIIFSFLLGLLSFAGFSQCIPYAGLSQETCDQTTQLDADTIGLNITSIIWSSNIPGVTISDTTAPNPTVSIANMLPGIYGDSGQVTVWFYLNVTCTTGTGIDSCPVTFYQVPQAYAGEDDSICGLEYDLQAQFDLVNNHSQGQWTYVASQIPVGAIVNFVNDTIPTTTVHVSTYGLYYFVWSEWNRENNNCKDYDTVIINFFVVPNINAGNDTSVCGNWAELNVISVGIGQWNAIGGAAYASYASTDSLNISYQDSTHAWVYHAIPNDTLTLYWTEYNSICVSVDSVDVYFAADVPAITFVQDSITCGNVFTGLDAQPPQYGYGYWIDTTTNTQFYDTMATPHPDSVVIAFGTYGYHYFYWIVNNGVCIDTSDVVPVLFTNTSTLHGIISNMNNPMDVYGYYSNNPITPIDIFNISSSDFYMPTHMGEYFFKTAYTTPQANYPDAYYNGTFSWSTAQSVQMTCNDTITLNFTLPSINVNSSGTGYLEGNIHYSGSLAPYDGASVFLIDSLTGTSINFTHSDINGDYSFDQVPAGHYFLNVDIFGLPQQSTHYIDVTVTNNQFYNLDFNIDTVVSTRNPIGIYADYSALGISTEVSTDIRISPNPSTGILFIESTQTPITEIKITDITGKTVKEITGNSTRLQINLENEPNGIYFVTVKTKENSVVKKVVLENQ